MEINYSIRTVHFYSDLHKFLTQKELSYEQIGTNTNSCIKIKQLTNRCRNPHQVVQYHATNSTDHCSDSHSELLGHYLPLNIDRRENRMKQKVKKLWDVAFSNQGCKEKQKKCTQLQMAIEESWELFHQERAKTRELERERSTIKWNNVYCKWRLVKCRRRWMNTKNS